MTNEQIREAAIENGFKAEMEHGYGFTVKVLISHADRELSVAEVSGTLNIPIPYLYHSNEGVSVYGSDA